MQGEFSVLRMLTEYFGSAQWMAVFVIATIIVLIFSKKKSKKVIFIALILFSVIVFNPLISSVLAQNDQAVFYRFLWILPTSIAVVFAALEIISRFTHAILKLIVGIIIVGVLYYVGVHTGDTAINRETSIENEYLLSNETVWMNELLENHIEDEKVRIAMPGVIQMQLRILNPKVTVAIKRADYRKYEQGRWGEISENKRTLISLVNGTVFPEPETMPKVFKKTKTEYIITLTTVPQEYMESCGCTKLDQTNFFILYKV